MNLFALLTLLTTLAIGTAHGQPANPALTEKLTEQKMTKGLSERADGTPGISYSGGVAGYAGPPRASDLALPTVIYPSPGSDPQAEEREAIQQAENERREALAEQRRQQALQREQAATEAQRAAWAQAQPPPGLRSHDLVRWCESRGLSTNYTTKSCYRQGGLSRGGGGKTEVKNPDNPQGRQDLYGGRNAPGSLIAACKGLAVDFVSGNCIASQGHQVNPHNLWPPFASPLPKPSSGELIRRCGALGRTADFVTGRCM